MIRRLDLGGLANAARSGNDVVPTLNEGVNERRADALRGARGANFELFEQCMRTACIGLSNLKVGRAPIRS